MRRFVLVTAALIAVAGCAGTSLPYKPEQQPAGATISAAYQIVGDRLKIELDTDGYRLEEAKILRPDGSELHPQTIEHVTSPSGGSGVSVGIGVGGGSWGGRGGGGVGGGVGIGVPVGGSSRVDGPTFAYFPLDQVGPAPWRLRVKLAGIEPTVFVLGPMPPA
ncbi:MAG: hypothetical protein ACREJV_02295, partial [Candidatus Rokuibacteriota bacterium]